MDVKEKSKKNEVMKKSIREKMDNCLQKSKMGEVDVGGDSTPKKKKGGYI